MRKSFTLIEVIISIFLFFFLYFSIYNIINYLNKNNSLYKRKIDEYKIMDLFIKSLYNDFLQAKKIKIEDNKIILNTFNSLYNLSKVNVVWIIKTDSLQRVEKISLKDSSNYILKFNSIKYFHIFHIKNRYLIYFEFLGKKIFFKIYK